MNALPIDLKASTPTLPTHRVASGMAGSGGDDFSRVFRDSLEAIAEKSQPAAAEEKPAEEAPQKGVEEKSKTETAQADEAQTPAQPQGQNMPAQADNLPAKVAEVVPVVLPLMTADGQAAAVALTAGGMNAVQQEMVNAQAGNPAVLKLAADAVKPGPEHVQGPQMSAPARQVVQNPAASGVQGARQAPITDMPAVSANVAGNETVRVAATAAQAMPPADEGAAATEALLQPQRSAQIVAQSAAASQVGLAQQVGGNTGLKPDALPMLAVDDVLAAPQGVGLEASSAPSAPTFADQVLSDALLGPTGPKVVAEPLSMAPRVVEVEFEMPMASLQTPAEVGVTESADAEFAAGDDVTPLAGLAPALATGVTAPATPAASASAPAPVVTVPAAALNTEIVKFAGTGGGRAVMEITSPDLGALKIDLSIDGKGVARMVVEATTSAARDQLEQGMRRLHDDFASLGLSLNVDVRQGNSGTAGREPWGQPQYAGVSDPRPVSVSERIQSIGAAPGAGSPDDKSRIHFYA